jgi:hypothetical protein
VKKRVIPK